MADLSEFDRDIDRRASAVVATRKTKRSIHDVTLVLILVDGFKVFRKLRTARAMNISLREVNDIITLDDKMEYSRILHQAAS